MKAQVIEARLQVNRVCCRNPDRRPITRLAPHTQGGKSLIRVRETEFVGQLSK
jgi:hypothetical protein